MTLYELVVGWTDPIDVNLLSQGDTPSGDMVGMTAELILRDRNTGTTLDTTGDVTIPDTSTWSVRYSPDASDLTPGVYHGRFKITDGNGKVAYFPSGEWDVWIIREET